MGILQKPEIFKKISDIETDLEDIVQDINAIGTVNANAELVNSRGGFDLLSDRLLLESDIKGTVQNVTTNVDGDVTQVEHVNGSSVVIRRDTFDYSTPNLIIETRLITATNATVIYKYHTDTLQVEVI